jgi:hypothetical protein
LANRSIRSTSLSEAPSAHDMCHNFVVSYTHERRLEQWFHKNQLHWLVTRARRD